MVQDDFNGEVASYLGVLGTVKGKMLASCDFFNEEARP
jgi:hypothetical protein